MLLTSEPTLPCHIPKWSFKFPFLASDRSPHGQLTEETVNELGCNQLTGWLITHQGVFSSKLSGHFAGGRSLCFFRFRLSDPGIMFVLSTLLRQPQLDLTGLRSFPFFKTPSNH